MKSNRLKSDDNLSAENRKQLLEQNQDMHKKNELRKQIVREVQLLNNFDPHKMLNEEFEKASLVDLINYSAS
jgi:hypothetical protein